MASKNESRAGRSTKCAPPTGWISPTAFISIWAVARPTPKSASMFLWLQVSVLAYFACPGLDEGRGTT